MTKHDKSLCRILLAVQKGKKYSSLIKNKLSELGYSSVSIASSRPETLQILKNESFDILLIDANLEGKYKGLKSADIAQANSFSTLIILSDRVNCELILYGQKLLPFSYIEHTIEIKKFDKCIIEASQSQKQKENSVNSESNKKIDTESLLWNLPGAAFRGLSDNILDISFISSQIKKISGYEVSELIKMDNPFVNLIIPEDLEEFKIIIESSRQSKNGFITKMRILRKDGYLNWVEISGKPIYSGSGDYLYIDGIIGDISESEERLIDTEAKFKKIIDSSPLGIYVCNYKQDDKLILVDSNPSADFLFDIDHSKCYGFDIEVVFPELATDGILEKMKQVAKNGYPFSYPSLIRESGSSYKVYEIHAFQISYLSVAVMANDISEETRAEEMLKSSEQRYRTLYETMSQGVVYQDSEGIVTSANPAAIRILGSSMDSMVGMKANYPYFGAIHEDGSPFPEDNYPSELAMMTGFEVRDVIMGIFNSVDKELHWLNVSATPLYEEGESKPNQVYTIIDDFSRRKLSERALIDSEKRLRRAVVSAPFPIMIHSEDGQVTLLSDRWKELSGYSEDDIPTYDTWLDKALGIKISICVSEFSESIYGIKNRVDEGERSVKTKCGDTRIWELSSAPLGHLPDDKRAIITMAVDITERRKSQNRSGSLINLFEKMEDMSPDEIVIYGIEECVRITGSIRGYFHTVNPKTHEVNQLVSWSIDRKDMCFREDRKCECFKTDLGFMKVAIEQKKTLIENNEIENIDKTEVACRIPLRRHLLVPIIEDDEVVAVIAVINKSTDYTESDLRHVTIFVKNVWTLIQRRNAENKLLEMNTQLQQLSVTDGLTKLNNRRFFSETYEKLWKVAVREGEEISAIMIDVDFFKLYNDNYGHIEGDKVLVNISNVIMESLMRPSDIAVRYGGEEFLILLPRTSKKGAKQVAEKILTGVEELKMIHEKSTVSEFVSISMGISTAYPKNEDKPYLFIEAADNALYKAKDSGRSRIELDDTYSGNL